MHRKSQPLHSHKQEFERPVVVFKEVPPPSRNFSPILNFQTCFWIQLVEGGLNIDIFVLFRMMAKGQKSRKTGLCIITFTEKPYIQQLSIFDGSLDIPGARMPKFCLNLFKKKLLEKKLWFNFVTHFIILKCSTLILFCEKSILFCIQQMKYDGYWVEK